MIHYYIFKLTSLMLFLGFVYTKYFHFHKPLLVLSNIQKNILPVPD